MAITATAPEVIAAPLEDLRRRHFDENSLIRAGSGELVHGGRSILLPSGRTRSPGNVHTPSIPVLVSLDEPDD
jgi:hypothetical protein